MHGKERNTYRVLIRKPERNYRLAVLVVDGRIIPKCILKKYVARGCIRYIWLRTGTTGGFI
jgi:hypothetical protein